MKQLAIVIAAALAVVVTVVFSQTSHAAAPLYVALGDSYSSGLGAEIDPTKAAPIANSYDPASGGCMRAYQSYPYLLAKHIGYQLRDVACAGAVTNDITAVGQYNLPPQINSVTSDARLVSITIGGNDIGFGGLMGCIKNKECDGNAPEAQYTLDMLDNQLQPRVTNVIAQIKQRAPNARILVGGYPQIYPYEGSSAGTCSSYLSGGEMSGWNYIQSTMNDRIKAAVVAVGGNVRYVDPYASNSPFTQKSSTGQTKDACSTWNQRTMNGYITNNNGATLHPNLFGQQAYAQIFNSARY